MREWGTPRRLALATALVVVALSGCTDATMPEPAGSQSTLTKTPTPGAASEPVAPEVTTIISYSGWNATTKSIEVSGFVSGVIENGGVCTLTAQLADATVAVEQGATANVADTQCGTLEVPASSLTPGEWTVTLAYSSETTTSSSDPATVEVPLAQ